MNRTFVFRGGQNAVGNLESGILYNNADEFCRERRAPERSRCTALESAPYFVVKDRDEIVDVIHVIRRKEEAKSTLNQPSHGGHNTYMLGQKSREWLGYKGVLELLPEFPVSTVDTSPGQMSIFTFAGKTPRIILGVRNWSIYYTFTTRRCWEQ